MEKLALIVPSLPPDAGGAKSEREAGLLREALGGTFSCLVVRRGAGGEADITDTAACVSGLDEAPSYTQRSILGWRRAGRICEDVFDCALVLDGLHPWALAAAERLSIRRRVFWLKAPPGDYLLEEDVPFFEKIYETGAVLCDGEAVQASFCRVFPRLRSQCYLVRTPPDPERYRGLTNGPACWPEDTADVVAVCRLECEEVERWIPRLAAGMKKTRPELRWHIIGEGSRRDRVLHQIVLCDVCEEMDVTDRPADIAPLLAQANAYLALPESGERDAERMARAMGKPVLPVEDEDAEEALLSALQQVKCGQGSVEPSAWSDREKLISLMKGEQGI